MNTVLSTVYPRWRGNTGSANLSASCWRFIPAGAGNTSVKGRSGAASGLSPLAREHSSTLRIASRYLSVYPRWRGNTRTGARTSLDAAVLSPLGAGTQQCT
ncbi:hypothetical protein KCP76_04400 [Salmonella enterica subsp. enterica serovar Weltevreden]|nr:hypothetical protein KCP76_04400 [Salmonella enterica subsp. enterica serovar Weltevreden]